MAGHTEIDIKTKQITVTPCTEAEEAAIAEADVRLTEEQIIAIARAGEIKARLDAIDRASIRSIRSIAADKHSTGDTDKLAELEAEAEALRSELASL